MMTLPNKNLKIFYVLYLHGWGNSDNALECKSSGFVLADSKEHAIEKSETFWEKQKNELDRFNDFLSSGYYDEDESNEDESNEDKLEDAMSEWERWGISIVEKSEDFDLYFEHFNYALEVKDFLLHLEENNWKKLFEREYEYIYYIDDLYNNDGTRWLNSPLKDLYSGWVKAQGK